MRADNISQEIRFANQIGVTLSTEERMKLEIALYKLSEKVQADEIQFWGRVDGTFKNYYIAVAHQLRQVNGFPKKSFFYTQIFYKSTSDFPAFASLPDIKPFFAKKGLSSREFFKGEHDSKGNICTELDRLSLVIHDIEYNCQIVPLGAYSITPLKELRRNHQFNGISLQQSKDLSSYLHFREPKDKEIKAIQRIFQNSVKDDVIYRHDFLENCTNDNPRNSWSIQSDFSSLNVTIRSLLWPGYLAYHRVNSQEFGGVYLGNGIKNQDLEFILT